MTKHHVLVFISLSFPDFKTSWKHALLLLSLCALLLIMLMKYQSSIERKNTELNFFEN